MPNVLGVDPGVAGALVLVDTDRARVLAVLDMPIVREGKQAWVDGHELGIWLVDLAVDRAVVELVHTYGGDDHKMAPGIAKLTRLAGGVETMLSSLGIPITHATASAWKGRAGLHKQPKSASLALARARLSWPDHLALRLAKHEGRAEAALIAVHGLGPAPAPPRAKRRSKAVEAAAAADGAPMALAGHECPTLLERFVAEHSELNEASLEACMVAMDSIISGRAEKIQVVSPKAVALKVGKAKLRSLGLLSGARPVRGRRLPK